MNDSASGDGKSGGSVAPGRGGLSELSGVCAIGASAGGLDPLETFFGSVPVDTGLAFVVIQHLSPDHESMMASLLGRHTAMEVRQASDGDALRANRVYLIPPDRVLTVEGEELRLSGRDHSASKSPSPHPIDTFFKSLAEQWGPNAAAIVLSGTGNDGAAGTEWVRRAGGLTLAQDATAGFEGMPTAATERGFVDAVASVPAMTSIVVDFFDAGRRPTPDTVDARYSAIEESIIADLAATTGIDFQDYKRGTVRRRIQHRMNVIAEHTIEGFAERIRSSEEERSALSHDILIGVTTFFRDQDVFNDLSLVVEDMLRKADEEERSARAWVVGCATGQEAYTIAMLLTEARDRLGLETHIQVFATDVHEEALSTATEGVYSELELENVNEERRERFFRRHDDGWRVLDELRALVTFARQNMLTDTPFSRIDLVSCRNALIYFTPTAQQRALWGMGFALRTGGHLLLGTSESPGFLTPDFEAISTMGRIYQKTGDSAIKSFRRRMGPDLIGAATPGMSIPRPPSGPDQSLLRAYDTILDEHFGAGLVINSRNEVLHVIGTAKDWLGHSTGRPTLDVHSLVKEPSLRLAIGSLLREVSKPDTDVAQRLVALDDIGATVVEGRQIRAAGEVYSFISGRPVDVPVEIPSGAVAGIDPADLDRIAQLESDLIYTRESLQASLEEQETSNEELNAANEELIASNEELQSSNEELSALNEELRTLNDEHHRRLQEVLELTADLEQILTSTEIGILLLDADQTIRRFSDPARDFFHLMASDQGRPFDHIRARFDADEFDLAVHNALDAHTPTTLRATMSQSGAEVLVRVRPYGLPQGGTGVAITVVDLGAAATSERESLLGAYIDTAPLNSLVFNTDRICTLKSLDDSTDLVGLTVEQICELGGIDPAEVVALMDQVDKSPANAAAVIRARNGRQAVFAWKFDLRGEGHYGLLGTDLDDLQATLANWVESQTVGVIAELLGVGAAVVHPDGTFGERFSAGSGQNDGTPPPLDLRENMMALSDIVASSAELGFGQIDQTVDMIVDAESRRVHVRGVRLGHADSNPYLTIVFDEHARGTSKP